MNRNTSRRPLSDLLLEMSESVIGLMPVKSTETISNIGLRPTSLSCSLPVETSFTLNDGQLELLVGFPQCQARTYFDRPLNRLAFHFEAEAI